jgi:large subunit ribosomal protein L30
MIELKNLESVLALNRRPCVRRPKYLAAIKKVAAEESTTSANIVEKVSKELAEFRYTTKSIVRFLRMYGMTETKTIRIQYYRSKNSTPFKHRLVVKGLGFTRLNQIVERVDNESIRGMVKAVPHLVRILED